MRFLVVSLGYHPDVIGGAWRVAASQATGLVARGHRVEVVTAHPGENRSAEEIRDGVALYRYPQSHRHFYSNWRSENRAAAALIRKRLAAGVGRSLVIQHHAYLGPAVASAAAPVLHIFHGPWAEEYRVARTGMARGLARRCLDAAVIRVLHQVEGRALRRAGRIIVLSRHFAGQLSRWHPGPLPPVEVAPGGVDLGRFRPMPDRAALRSERGIAPDDTLLVALRRLEVRMGLDVLLDAFARIAGSYPRVRLWLTGRGPAEGALKARIGQHGLGDRVRFLGFIPEEELPSLLNAADLAVMPSLDLEGFGLATAEALACGTPVLGSRAGATPELLQPLAPGLLFEPGSVDDLAAGLRGVLEVPSRLPDRAQCAAYARERFSWDAQVAACERAASDLVRSA